MSQGMQGSIVALVTPFRNGKVDEPKLRELVEFHIKQGTDGILACGTTGEDPGLTPEEHERVVETIVATAAGRIFVMVGTGSNSTAHTIDLTAQAERAGAQAALVVNPYYNKPTQEGLYRHFRAVAESTSLPVFVYNIQSRTAVNVETATLERLVDHLGTTAGAGEALRWNAGHRRHLVDDGRDAGDARQRLQTVDAGHELRLPRP